MLRALPVPTLPWTQQASHDTTIYCCVRTELRPLPLRLRLEPLPNRSIAFGNAMITPRRPKPVSITIVSTIGSKEELWVAL